MKYLNMALLLSGLGLALPPIAVLKADIKENPLSLSTNLTTASSLHHRGDADYSASVDMELIPSYKASKDYTLKFYTAWTKSLVDERKSKHVDSFVGLSRPLYSSESSILSISGESRLYLPTDKDNRRMTSYMTRFYLSPRFLFDLSRPLFTGLTFSFIPYGARDFHKYETGLSGKSNTRYTVGSILGLALSPVERLNLSFLFRYARSWTHQGSRKDDTFRFVQEIAYSFPKNFSLSLGHLNEGSALGIDGVQSNIRLFNRFTSTLYGSLSKTF